MQRCAIFRRSFQCLSDKLLLASNIMNGGVNFQTKFTFSSQPANDIKNKKKFYITDVHELIRYVRDKNTFYLKLLTNIQDGIDYSKVNIDDIQLLLNCCGDSLSDSSRKSRDTVVQKMFKELTSKNNLNLNIYHAYINVCTENSVKLNVLEFLSDMKYEPTQHTYKLLLKNISEQGDVKQLHELLEIMKSRMVQVDEDVFNNIVLAHIIQEGLKASKSVLETMKLLQVSQTTKTTFSILKGIIKRGSIEDLQTFLQQFSIKLNENQLLEIVLELGLNDNVSWLSEIKTLYSDVDLTRDFVILLEQKCIHLVHMNKPQAAWDIFQYFIKPAEDVQGDNYGFSILREMLFCQTDIDKIISIAKYLKENQLNTYALEKLAEICLRHKFEDEAWKLLQHLPELRPHFFWPLLVKAFNDEGEGGIFKAISKIKSLGVKLDYESLRNFILPFCNLDDSVLLVNKLKTEGFTVKEILEPLLGVLIQNNKTKKAAELLNSYTVNIVGKDWFKQLASAWISTKDSRNIVILLQKVCEANSINTNTLVGTFTTKALGLCKKPSDFEEYTNLLQTIKDSRLRIDSSTADNLCNNIPNNEYNQQIWDKIDLLRDFGLKSETSPHIPHPRHMKLEEQECHLLELKEKAMNTRGIIRRLMMQHLACGNLERVQELRQEFLNQGYEESIGMKSSLMHSFILKSHLESALNVYKEIKQLNPNFNIDSFKIIDLCTILVKENKFHMAMDVLQTESKSKNLKTNKAILRNCLELLNAFRNDTEQTEMFEFLTKNGYCSISNITLGPLINLHLVNKNFDTAVSTYVKFTEQYKHTPLQLTLFKEITKLENESYLQKVLNSTMKVHGTVPTQVTLIAAFAENDMEKPLTKFLQTLTYPIQKEMEKRCDRWITEQKIEPLQVLFNSCIGSRVNRKVFDFIYLVKCILKMHTLNNDYESALKFYQSYQEEDIFQFDKQIEQMKKILEQNKSKVSNNTRV